MRPGLVREQQHPVAHQHRFLDVVRDEDDALDRQLAFLPEVEKIRTQIFRRQNIERRERLVHQQDVGMHDQRAREADALAHAAGKLARVGGLVAVEADQIDGGKRALADFLLPARPSASSPSCTFSSTVSHGKQREALEHHGDAARRAIHRCPR